MRFLALAIAVFAFLVSPAQAKHRHHHKHHRHHVHRPVRVAAAPECVIFCSSAVPTQAIASGLRRIAAIPSTVVAHPAGCPTRQFCGCGASVRLFGRSVRDLWLAANWYRFPRAAPAPGMAAVRPHHVFVLEADLGGGKWQVFDANSGRHLTRVHARSIAGFTIVNPRGHPA
jgi:hypothetical protein